MIEWNDGNGNNLDAVIRTNRVNKARELVAAIHEDLNDRRGLHIDDLDEDVQKQIFNQHLKIVLDIFSKI